MFKSNTNGHRSLKQKLLQTIKFASIGVLVGLSFMGIYVGHVQSAPSTTLNFQARLLNGSGSLVADGTYNVQFNLYNVVSGGTSLWTETYLNSNTQGVTVRNGYMSVKLGTLDSLADENDINWNEELWLGMTVRGTGSCSFGACSPTDSEMSPRIKLTAIPYAFQANQLAHTSGANRATLGFNTLTNDRSILLPDADGTVCLQNSASCGFLTGAVADFIQNGTAQQTNANFNISASAGVAATITGAAGQNIFVLNQNGGTAALTIADTGNATFAGTLAVNGGAITSSGALNITPGGAMTLGATTQAATVQGSTVSVSSTGAGNDITLTSADQIVLSAASGGVDITGNVGLGSNTAPIASSNLRINHDITADCSFSCSGIAVDVNGTVNSIGNWGVYSRVSQGAAATFDAAAFYAASASVSGAGAIGDNYGVLVAAQTVGTNNAGIAVAETTGTKAANLVLGTTDLSSFTGNYSIYNSSTDNNYFAGALGIGDPTPDALFSVGSSSQFQVNSSGAIAAATGITSSGTITFSGLDCSTNLNGGTITANASGVLSCADDDDSAVGAFIQGGNTFGSLPGNVAILGTDDANSLAFETNGVTRLTIDTSGNATLTGDLTVQGTGNSTFSGNLLVNGNTTIGNASGDSLTINSTAVSIPNNLNFDSNTLFIDATNDRIGIGNATPGAALEVTGNIFLTKEAARTIKIADSTTAATSGATLSILGANGVGADGGAITIQGGTVNSGNGNGGVVTVKGGTGVGLTGGGALNLGGGDSLLAGGVVNITGGAGGALGGGAVTISGGNSSGTNSVGAGVVINGGRATGNAVGGPIQFNTSDALASGSTLQSLSTKAILLSNGNFGIGDTTPVALFTVGNGDLFQVNSSGAIAAATGITSSGTITFSGLDCSANLNGGTITANASGVLSCADDDDTGSTVDLDGVYDNDADKELLIDSATGLIFDMATTGDFLIQDSNATIATFSNTGAITFAPTSGQSLINIVSGAGTLTNTIAGTGNAITNLTSTGDFVVQDNGAAFATFDDAGGITLTPAGTSDLTLTLDSDSNFAVASAVTGTASVDAQSITVTNSTSSGTQRGLFIQNAASTGLTEALIALDNADTDTAVADGVLITSTAGAITDGIDVSDVDLVNGLNLGQNFLLGDGIRQFSSSSTVWTWEDTSGNDLMTLTDGAGAAAGILDVNGRLDVGTTGAAGAISALNVSQTFTNTDGCGFIGCYGAFVTSTNNSSGGTVGGLWVSTGTSAGSADATGIVVVAATEAGSGVINTGTGIIVAAQGAGTNNLGIAIGESTGTNQANLVLGQTTAPTGAYSIYNSSTDQNYFAGALGIGDTTPDAQFTVGTTSQFQVNSSGAIAAATGITSSGTITFSGLNCTGLNGGALTATAGVLSCTDDDNTAATIDLDTVYDTDSDKELLIDSATGLLFDMTTTGNFQIQDSNVTIANFTNAGAITFTPTSGQSFSTTVAGAGTITQTIGGTGNGIVNLTSTGDYVIQDNGATFATFSDAGAIAFAPVSGQSITTTVAGTGTITNTISGTGNAITNLTSTGDFVIQDNGVTFASFSDSGAIELGNTTAAPSISLEVAASGSINIGAGTATKTINIANGGGVQTVHVGTTNSTSQTNINAGSNGLNLTASGSSDTGTTIRTSTNSTNALLVQKSSGSDTLFRVDSTNNRLYVGNQTAAASADSTLLVVDSASTANLPTGVNGGIIYDSTTGKFKIYEGGAYKTLCNLTDLGCGAGATVNLQNVYDNDVDGGNVSVTTTDADGSIIWNLHNSAGTDPNFVVNVATSSTGEFKVQNNTTDVLQIGAAGQLQLDVQGSGGGLLIGTDASLYRSGATALRTNSALTVDGLLTGSAGATISGGTINLNTTGANATNINTGGTGDVTIGNSSSSVDITLDSGGTIAIGTGAQARTVNIATGAAAQALTIGSTNTTSSTTIQGGTGNITLLANGGSGTGTVVGNSNNSTNAFRIQSSGATDTLFRADTTNNRVYVGNATASAGTDTTLLVVDSAATANLPTGVNGGIVYDSTVGKFKVYEGGSWKTLCNTVDAGCGASGANQDLQEAYDNSTTPATIETSSNTKNVIIKSGSGNDSTGVFQIQSAASDTLFRADTTNNRVYVGNATGTSGAANTLFVLDAAQDTDYLPTGVNGGMIYDAEAGKFKVYENGAWKTLCNSTDLGCGSAGVSQSLQDAYNNSSTPATIATTGTTKDIIFKSGVGFDADSMFQIQNANGDELLVADTANFRVAIGTNTTPANGVLSIGTNTTVASGGLYFGTDTNLYRSAASTLRTDGNFQLGEGSDRTFNVQGRSTNAAGNGLTIAAGNAGAGGSAFAGGNLTLQGGDAAGTGNANGGNVILNGGAGTGTGARGLVVIGTPTFTTTLDDANCFTSGTLVASSCTIANSSVSNSSAIVVGFNQDGQTATLPDPLNTTAGRIIYITGANGTSDFTLAVNGGVGQGNQIAMRANTSATMIWNGNDWTAAGASSSTTLQAAYNNTLTSAGGAEIVLNNTASSNGLTIRNNQSNPITGGLFEVQSSIGTNLFSVNNRGTELAANGGSETEDTWTTNWVTVSGATVGRTTAGGEYVTGTAGVEVATTSTSGSGIKNNLSGNPVNTIGAKYQVSFAAKSSIADTPVEVVYSRDGGTTETACTDYGATGANELSDTEWTKITCTITIASSTAATDPDLIIRKTGATTPTIWIDNLSFMRNDSTTAPSNVQIGGGLDGGPITLFTLDRASAPPVQDGDTTYLGSMYYDTVTGRIQCYESDGWGACGSAPDNYVNLTPEFAGAVLNGPGVGTMTADFCSNSGTLSVNSSLCASGQALNFYRWTSPQATEQTYSIYVTYQLPAAFKGFQDNNTVTLTARTDSTTNGSVTYEMFRSEGGSLIRCYDSSTEETPVTTSANLWQTVGINGNEADGCGFTSTSANTNVVFKINVKARNNANVYVSNLGFTTVGQ